MAIWIVEGQFSISFTIFLGAKDKEKFNQILYKSLVGMETVAVNQ